MKTVSVVIPVFNEGIRIQQTLKELKRGFCMRGIRIKELIFVNDGSADATLSILKKEKKELEKALKCKVYLLSYLENRGRGYAVRFGCMIAKSDYIIYADADLSIPLYNIDKFLPFMHNGYDLIYGSKKKPGAKALIPRGLVRNIVGYGHSVIASFVLSTFAWDYQGGFKMFSKSFVKEVFPLLNIDRWGFDMEVIFLGKKMNYSSAEIPITWAHVEKDSKVKLIRDIRRSLYEMIKIRKNWIKKSYNTPLPSYTYVES